MVGSRQQWAAAPLLQRLLKLLLLQQLGGRHAAALAQLLPLPLQLVLQGMRPGAAHPT